MLAEASHQTSYISRGGAVFRAAAFFAIIQWVATPFMITPILHAIGVRYDLVNDFKNHVFSAPRVAIQDLLITTIVVIVSTSLILTERRPPLGSLFTTVARRMNLSDGRPWVLRCLIGCFAGPVLLSAILGTLFALGDMRIDLQHMSLTDLIRQQAVMILTFAAAGVAEELLCRGYVLRTLSDGLGFPAAAILTSAYFAWMHYAEGDTVTGSLGVFEFAIFSCLAIRTSGSLAFSIGFHGAWDYAESAIYGVPDSSFTFAGTFARSTFHGPIALTGGSAGPEASALLLAIWVVMIVTLLRFTSMKALAQAG